ncbi:MAG: helix-turn-helix domain-containing protein [Patescibacteria group bacterium]
MIELTVLQNIGLNEKEARVYLSLLELGSGTVQQIARHADLKRPSAYLVLDSLLKKGFVIETPSRGVKKYSSQDPEYVLLNFQNTEKQFKELLPVFHARYHRATRPQVKFYEGKDKLRWVYENLIFPYKEIYFYSFSIAKFGSLFPDLLQKFETDITIPGKYTKVLELMVKTKENLAFAKKTAKPNHPIRLLPVGKTMATDNAIVGESLFIISLEKLFCVQISSPEITETYRHLIQFAWDSAMPIS